MPSLVDTNILVYRVDPRDPAKQRRATALLEAGIADRSLVLAQQDLRVTRLLSRNIGHVRCTRWKWWRPYSRDSFHCFRMVRHGGGSGRGDQVL